MQTLVIATKKDLHQQAHMRLRKTRLTDSTRTHDGNVILMILNLEFTTVSSRVILLSKKRRTSRLALWTNGRLDDDLFIRN